VIYVLKGAEPHARVNISALCKSEAAVELLQGAPYNLALFGAPTSPQLAQWNLQFVASLPENVAVRRLEVPRSLARVPEVVAHVASDLHHFQIMSQHYA
jgi:hypothetical protein